MSSVRNVDLIEIMEAPASERFDYSKLDPATASKVRAAAGRVHCLKQRYVQAVLETGRELLAVKELLEHGEFGRWLDAEFGWTDRTAQNYMRAAAEFGDKSETVSYLPTATIYKLAAASTPAPAREEIVKRLASGERLEPDEIGSMVDKAREEDRKAREKAREEAELAKLSPEEQKIRSARKKREILRGKARQAELERIRKRDEAERARMDDAAQRCVALLREYMPDDKLIELVQLFVAAAYRLDEVIHEAAGLGSQTVRGLRDGSIDPLAVLSPEERRSRWIVNVGGRLLEPDVD